MSTLSVTQPEHKNLSPGDLSLFRLLSIAVGFFGIQYAWAVQYSQMSTFLESLGSVAWLTALIWCAGPVTGTVTQPILGAISDRTRTWLGSRRPFLLAGALVCSFCMILMPNAAWLGHTFGFHPLLAAGLILWIWDTSINVCQGPIRWLVVDVVNKTQQPLTFSLMGFVLAIGAATCFYLGSLYESIHFLFYFGAAAMLITMGWTILSTPEDGARGQAAGPISPASELAASALNSSQPPLTLTRIAQETWRSLSHMHPKAQKLCWVNGLTWFGGQCMFVFFPLFIVHQVYQTWDTGSTLYDAGRQHVSACWLGYYIVCFIASLFIGRLCRQFSMKFLHTLGLLGMAGAILAMAFVHTPQETLVAMSLAGVGWATTMSIPFAWAARYCPEGKGGAHLAAFNIYIAFASFIANLVVGPLVEYTQTETSALLLAGSAVLLSAILLQGVRETDEAPELPRAQMA